MKKVFALMLAAGMFAVVACGEGQKAADSSDSAKSAAVETMANVADSSTAVLTDSTAFKADSAATK